MTATPIVGREVELDQLDRQLKRALDGKTTNCFVTGEPGAGKSSLVMEFARRAQQRAPELLVTCGTCDAYTGTGDAYLPFREVLLQLTGDVERSLAAGRTTDEGARRLETFALFAGRALVENGADLVGLFVPGGSLLARLGGMAVKRHHWAKRVHQKLYGGSERPSVRMLQQENVFEQYTQVLEAMSRERPLLVLLDDLHWVDGASVALLFHLSRRLVKARLMILGVYRSEEVARPRDGKPHPLQGVVAELTRLQGDLTVDLDKLRARSFIDALVDARPNRLDERFRDSLAHHTGGNPLFAVELLQSLEASGALTESSVGTLEQVSAIEWRSLPSRIAGVIESRMTLLTAAQKGILAAASVQGEEFVADAVAEALRIERRDVVRELSGPMQKELRLVTAVGIQEVEGRQLARYRFRHNLVQDYLYRQLDEIERADLHGVTGLALERVHDHDPAPVAVSLATHFTAAGDWSRAIRYRVLAAESAARAFGHNEAVEHFEQALAIAEHHPVAAAAMDRIAAHERLGDEQLLVRSWASSAASFNASLALIGPANRTVRARLLRKLARVDERQSRYPEAVQYLEAAEAELGDPGQLGDPGSSSHPRGGANGSTSRSPCRSSITGRATSPAWTRPTPDWMRSSRPRAHPSSAASSTPLALDADSGKRATGPMPRRRTAHSAPWPPLKRTRTSCCRLRPSSCWRSRNSGPSGSPQQMTHSSERLRCPADSVTRRTDCEASFIDRSASADLDMSPRSGDSRKRRAN